MPLTILCGELTDAGFLIERIVEPVPVPCAADSATIDPDEAAKLHQQPSFIALRVLRR